MSAPREQCLPFGAQTEPIELASSGEGSAGYECDRCGEPFDGVPAGSGLFLWTRGDEVRYEEPPLCPKCAEQVSLNAMLRWDFEEEEEG